MPHGATRGHEMRRVGEQLMMEALLCVVCLVGGMFRRLQSRARVDFWRAFLVWPSYARLDFSADSIHFHHSFVATSAQD